MVFKNYSHGGDIYHNNVKYDFSANVNPLGTPPQVIEAIQASAKDIAKYPDPYCDELRAKLAQKNNTEAENIICANGAAELIFQFVQAINPKKALLVVPSFAEYKTALETVNCKIEYYVLQSKDSFALTEDFIEKITEDIDVIFICNPNNPTGLVVSYSLMMKIFDKCRRTKTAVMIDECFMNMTDDAAAYTVLPQLTPNDNFIILRAFTKLYGMAGVRLGFGISKNTLLLEKISALQQPWNVSHIAQAAGVAALDCDGFAEHTKQLIAAEKEYLKEKLTQLGIEFICGKANYLLIKGEKVWAQQLLQQKILVRCCGNYIGLDDRYYRIAVHTHAENEILINVLSQLKRNG